MKRYRIVGFGSADGLGGLCDPGTVEYNGQCLPNCPSGTEAVNRGEGDEYDYRCEGTGTRVTNGGSSGGGVSSPAYSKAGSGTFAVAGALIVLGLVAWGAYSLLSPTSD